MTQRRQNSGPLLVITGLWPTEDMPSAGIFVKNRLRGVPAVVIAPSHYKGNVVVRYVRLAWQAMKVRGRFSGVEAHVLYPTGLIGLLSARLRRLPLVVYAHGSDVSITARRNIVNRWLAGLVARQADAVVTNSRATAQRVRELGRDPQIIPPGVDIATFKPSPKPGSGRVLYLGGKRHHKGYDRALPLVDTAAGPLLNEVRPEDVPGLIADHDVVLVPSRSEGFGLVAAEAVASGRWVVATNVDGLREVVSDGVNGTLVDGDDFAAALRSVPDYDPFAVAATASRFSLEEHQRAMAAVWRRIHVKRGAPGRVH